MAGLIARLFGGASRPPDPNPHPGIGGYSLPAGRSGEGGFPGSTSRTRTFRGNNPRAAHVRSDTNAGWESGVGPVDTSRQASFRGDVPGSSTCSPRSTTTVALPRGTLRAIMQDVPGTNLGGPMLKTGPGNDTAGGELSSRTAHDPRQYTTQYRHAQPLIGEGTPGSANVRNTIAERYKNAPGQMHTYRPAPRADQAGVVPGGQAADGNVSNTMAAQGTVTVQNRFQMFGTGNQSWSVLRQMPYTGRGDGARGADLNGHRYYAEGQADQFWNAGQGDYGIARQRGGSRPVGFTQPAPWTANFYDTTDSVQSGDTPQSPDITYISPQSGRASNSTGRTG